MPVWLLNFSQPAPQNDRIDVRVRICHFHEIAKLGRSAINVNFFIVKFGDEQSVFKILARHDVHSLVNRQRSRIFRVRLYSIVTQVAVDRRCDIEEALTEVASVQLVVVENKLDVWIDLEHAIHDLGPNRVSIWKISPEIIAMRNFIEDVPIRNAPGISRNNILGSHHHPLF